MVRGGLVTIGTIYRLSPAGGRNTLTSVNLRNLFLGAVLVVFGCASPYPARTPAPLPADAVELDLQTAAPATSSAGGIDTCPDAQLEQVRLARDGNQVRFLLEDTGDPRAVIWPRGFSARLYQGRAELVAPDGEVIAAEGELLNGVGGSGPAPDPFSVCTVGSTTYGPAS